MPQVFNCLCCYDCKTFQVQQVKKVPKWTCKMCGAKQSLKKVYGQGSGAECRKLVQNLNIQKMNTTDYENVMLGDSTIDEIKTLDDDNVMFEDNDYTEEKGEKSISSKWEQFLDDNDEVTECDAAHENVEERFTTDRDAILKIEREAKKVNRQQWKARKLSLNKSNPYNISGKAQRRLDASNNSRNFTPTNSEQIQNTEHIQMKQVSSNILSSNNKKQIVERSHTLNEFKKKERKPLGNSNSKWSKFVKNNQDEISDVDDSEIVDQKLNCTEYSNCRLAASNDVVEYGRENMCVESDGRSNQFNLNIDIDDVLNDW